MHRVFPDAGVDGLAPPGYVLRHAHVHRHQHRPRGVWSPGLGCRSQGHGHSRPPGGASSRLRSRSMPCGITLWPGSCRIRMPSRLTSTRSGSNETNPATAPTSGQASQVGPRRVARVPDVVVATHSLVRAERLPLRRGERGFGHVSARDIPAGREPGLIKRQRPGRVGDHLAAVPDHQVTAGLADVDPVVGIGSVADDPVIFLVEGVHRPPGERHPPLQLARVIGQFDVLPGRAILALLPGPDGVPGRRPEIPVLGGVLAGSQDVREDVAEREVGHRVVAGLVQQHDIFAVRDPFPSRTGRAFAVATARRTAAAPGAGQGRGSGRSPPGQAVLAARLGPLSFPS